MTILFLHGWMSVPGGAKPTYLARHGFDVITPRLPDNDFEQSLNIAQGLLDEHRPGVIVGSSRGGAIAMNLRADAARLVLLCPAWKRWGTADKVPAGTRILHARADNVIPFRDSQTLVQNSGLPDSALIAVGDTHRQSDPASLAAMLQACRSEV